MTLDKLRLFPILPRTRNGRAELSQKLSKVGEISCQRRGENLEVGGKRDVLGRGKDAFDFVFEPSLIRVAPDA